MPEKTGGASAPSRYLIIGGVYKSATTSLYRYLSDHPHVCPSNVKETGFFLDRDYPIPVLYRYTDGRSRYDRFFAGCADRSVRLEGSPFYFYSRGAPERIKAMLHDVHMIFVLRDPIARLVSCYRYERMGTPAMDVGFDEYVRSQADALDRSHELERSTQLAMGRYARYLRDWLAVFGPDAVSVVLFEDLAIDPLGTLDRLCLRVGLETGHYLGYRFAIFNRSVTAPSGSSVRMRSAVDETRLLASRILMRAPRLYRALKTLKRRLEPVARPTQTSAPRSAPLSAETRQFLSDYYRSDVQELTRLIGRDVPWTVTGVESTPSPRLP